MDKTGTVHKRWFGKTVINSAQRFTYEDAQKAINYFKNASNV
jgi:exoribonuclease R